MSEFAKHVNMRICVNLRCHILLQFSEIGALRNFSKKNKKQTIKIDSEQFFVNLKQCLCLKKSCDDLSKLRTPHDFCVCFFLFESK